MSANRPAVAYSYVRFSSPEQAKGDSLRRQTEAAAAWCKRNGARLDTSTTLHDLGTSAFTGAHRQNPDRHALAAFLKLVEQGRVPKGSVLICEALDRLSREHIQPALRLLLNLLQSGVRVVQLIPAEQVFDDKSESMALMMAIMELSRGNSESRVKSERVGAAWAEKKKRAAENGDPLTKLVPAWLKVVGGKFAVREDAAEAVRAVYRLATAGYGVGPLTRKLNAEKVRPIGSGKHWAASYVSKILRSRATVGEYAPMRYKGRHAIVGSEPPIPNYFPAVVTEQQWYAAQAAIDQRRHRPGRVGDVALNLFSGLLKDATDGDSIQVRSHGAVRYLVPYKVKLGTGEGVPFPFVPFERAVLGELSEIDPRELLPQDRKGGEVLEVAGRLAAVEGRLERVKAKLVDEDGDVGALVDVVRKLEADRRALADKLATARQEAASPLGEAWGECKSLLEALDSAPDPADARLRLRGVLRRVVEGMLCLFVARGRFRLAAVQVRFAGGRHRDYLIGYDPGVNNPKARKPSRTWVRSFAAESKGLDLRKPDHARKLEKALQELDLDTRTGV